MPDGAGPIIIKNTLHSFAVSKATLADLIAAATECEMDSAVIAGLQNIYDTTP